MSNKGRRRAAAAPSSGHYRPEDGALIKSLVLDLAAAGFTGYELAQVVEANCPWEDKPRRRAWQEQRLREVGRLRRHREEVREYAGVMRFLEGGES